MVAELNASVARHLAMSGSDAPMPPPGGSGTAGVASFASLAAPNGSLTKGADR